MYLNSEGHCRLPVVVYVPAYVLAKLVLHLDMVAVMPGDIVVHVAVRPYVVARVMLSR